MARKTEIRSRTWFWVITGLLVSEGLWFTYDFESLCVFKHLLQNSLQGTVTNPLFNAGANLFYQILKWKTRCSCAGLQRIAVPLLNLNLCFFPPTWFRKIFNTKFKTATLITSHTSQCLFFTTKMLTCSTFSPEAQTSHLLPPNLCVKLFLMIILGEYEHSCIIQRLFKG